jgi:hypothetical protein
MSKNPASDNGAAYCWALAGSGFQRGEQYMVPERITITNNHEIYECFPDVAITHTGRLVVVYRESDSHGAKAFSHIVWRVSDDLGETWSEQRYLIRSDSGADGVLHKWNCPRVAVLKDGRVAVVCDVYPQPPGERFGDRPPIVHLWFSSNNAEAFEGPMATPAEGIVPERIVQLRDGSWLLAAHRGFPPDWRLVQRVWRSEDQGVTWEGPFVVADREGLNLCEAGIVELPGGEIVAYMRENSGRGWPAYKSISRDGGRTWEGPFETLMGGAHRPTAGLLPTGEVMVTYRYFPGRGARKLNTFAYLESVESALETEVARQQGIILPLDHDRSARADTGYTGWVVLPDGVTIFIVNYIVDDAPTAQIRGYYLYRRMF